MQDLGTGWALQSSLGLEVSFRLGDVNWSRLLCTVKACQVVTRRKNFLRNADRSNPEVGERRHEYEECVVKRVRSTEKRVAVPKWSVTAASVVPNGPLQTWCRDFLVPHEQPWKVSCECPGRTPHKGDRLVLHPCTITNFTTERELLRKLSREGTKPVGRSTMVRVANTISSSLASRSS